MKSYYNYEKNESTVTPMTDNYEMEEPPTIISRRVRGYVPTDVEEAMIEPETEQSVARDYPSVNY